MPTFTNSHQVNEWNKGWIKKILQYFGTPRRMRPIKAWTKQRSPLTIPIISNFIHLAEKHSWQAQAERKDLKSTTHGLSHGTSPHHWDCFVVISSGVPPASCTSTSIWLSRLLQICIIWKHKRSDHTKRPVR